MIPGSSLIVLRCYHLGIMWVHCVSPLDCHYDIYTCMNVHIFFLCFPSQNNFKNSISLSCYLPYQSPTAKHNTPISHCASLRSFPLLGELKARNIQRAVTQGWNARWWASFLLPSNKPMCLPPFFACSKPALLENLRGSSNSPWRVSRTAGQGWEHHLSQPQQFHSILGAITIRINTAFTSVCGSGICFRIADILGREGRVLRWIQWGLFAGYFISRYLTA